MENTERITENAVFQSAVIKVQAFQEDLLSAHEKRSIAHRKLTSNLQAKEEAGSNELQLLFARKEFKRICVRPS